MSVATQRAGLVKRFPRVGRYLAVQPGGGIQSRFNLWDWAKEQLPPAEQAEGYEEWADFYEWHLAQRTEELAGNDLRRRAAEQWTDDMAYLSRRCAAYARGEDPGEPIPSWVRRPDLYAERRPGQARAKRQLVGVV